MYADSDICSISLTTVRFVYEHWMLLSSAIIVIATYSVYQNAIDSAEVFCCEVIVLVDSFSSNFYN
jgi:hypothetical protein